MSIVNRVAVVLLAIAITFPFSTTVSAQAGLIPQRVCLDVQPAVSDEPFDMPLVAGKSFAAAQAELCQKGLTVWLDPVWKCDSPREQVTSQQPVAGASVKRGSYVIISVNQSGGAKIPNLVGKSYETAVTTARELGFELKLTTNGPKTDEGVSKTCGEPSVKWTSIETQSPAAGGDQCNSDRNWSISVTRTKLVQGKYGNNVCHPRETCGPSGKFC